MPFLPSSRYARTELVQVETARGPIAVVKLRRLPAPPAAAYTVDAEDRVDTIAHRRFGDAARYWHVADANTELAARALAEPGRAIEVPEAP